jgi:CheY-like chemotaxis protein
MSFLPRDVETWRNEWSKGGAYFIVGRLPVVRERTPLMNQILFIEDDPTLGPVYETQLRNAGFAVTRALDGEAGLNALQTGRPDLILLDLMLPRISGLELLQIIRSSTSVKGIPIVVFTNLFQEENLQKIRQLGVERILSKSQYVPREVVTEINEVLNGSVQGRGGAESGHAVDPVADERFQTQLAEHLGSCRRWAADLGRESTHEGRLPMLRVLRNSIRKLVSLSASVDLRVQAYFCEALDAFLDELIEQPERLTLSGLRTVAQSIDFLFEEFDFDREFMMPEDLTFRVLVVDDDAISRRAVQVALGRIKQQAAECATAREALDLCTQRNFDLIFVDVDMPEITGYSLCEQIRKLDTNRGTPVIFVTGHTDLQTRAQSTLSGGNDFIGKPFHFMELAVKSLLHLLRSKLKPCKSSG